MKSKQKVTWFYIIIVYSNYWLNSRIVFVNGLFDDTTNYHTSSSLTKKNGWFSFQRGGGSSSSSSSSSASSLDYLPTKNEDSSKQQQQMEKEELKSNDSKKTIATFSTKRRRRLLSTRTTNTNNNNDNELKNNHKKEDEYQNDYYPQISYCSIQGRRNHMEDEYIIVCPSKNKNNNNNNNEGIFAAIFDGHGGTAVSRYLRQNLYAQLQAALPTLSLQKQKEKDNDTITTTTTTTATSIMTENQTMNQNEGEEMTTSKKEENDSTTSINYNNESREDKNKTLSSKTTTTSSSSSAAATTIVFSPELSMEALRYAFQKVDSQVQRISHWSFQGSTAVVVWLLPTTNKLIVANVGDSRAIYIPLPSSFDDYKHNENNSTTTTTTTTSTSIQQLTKDHKPNEETERNRIYSVGGTVKWCGLRDQTTKEPIPNTGVYRMNGNLALSRAIGDRSEKPFISSQVDITSMTLPTSGNNNDNNDCIVLASDGLWDVMTNEQIQSFLHTTLQQKDQQTSSTITKQRMAKSLVKEALRLGSTDNITIIIIWLTP